MLELNREEDEIVYLGVTENLDTGAFERSKDWVLSQDYAQKTWVEGKGYLDSDDLNGYATETWVQSQGYLTQHQDISGKANVSDLNAEIARAEGVEASLQRQIDTLDGISYHVCVSGEYDPTTGMPTISNPDENTFYLVPGGDAPNLFTEWIYINSAWEIFGSGSIDLSNYVTTSQLNTALADKQNTLTFDSTPTALSNNPVTSSGIKSAIDAKYTKPSSGIPKSDLDSSVKTSLEKADSALQTAPVSSVDGKTGAVNILPTGGTQGQVLKKTSSTNYAVEWANESGGGGAVDSVNGKTGVVVLDASDVGALPSSTSIPTKTSDLTNDSGYGTYTKPSGGIPKTDLASGVQSSLDKADSALQTAPVTSVNNQTGAVVLSIPSTASDVGAIPAPQSPTSGQYLSWNGSAWVATSLPVYSGGVS